MTRVAEQVPENDNATSILQVIERAAQNPSVDPDKMERLLTIYERVKDKQAETAYNVSMNQAQANVSEVVTDLKNSQTNSRYASFTALDRILRPIYIDAGFSLSFDTGDAPAPDMVRVLCLVAHRDGFKRIYHIDMPADGKGAKGGDVMTKTHAAGSAVSYGMRYLLKMIFNVAVRDPDDDDGNQAGRVPITESQAADLRALATEIGANIPAFLKVIGAKTFELIPADRYKDALATLEAKRKRGAS